ncbi:hypothetical protein ACLOJK_036254 [Asimina triloba]
MRLFDEMPERNVVSWTSLMVGYLKNGNPKEAVNAYRQMRWEGVEGNQNSFATVISSCGLLKDEVEDAVYVFSQMEDRDTISWNAMISTLSHKDQVLSSMQQKLDDLCEQMNTMKDWTESGGKLLLENSVNECSDTELCCCGCPIHEVHGKSAISNSNWNLSIEAKKDTSEKESSQVEMFKILPLSGNEQEERRMSDLSDWCSNVKSSSEIQLNTLAVEQDIYNLRRECEEKDATITELTDIARASNIAGSKRISELEDIIKRKNLIISKLKKDMMYMVRSVMFCLGGKKQERR